MRRGDDPLHLDLLAVDHLRDARLEAVFDIAVVAEEHVDAVEQLLELFVAADDVRRLGPLVLHDAAAAEQAADQFERQFSRKELPTDAAVVRLSAEEWGAAIEKRVLRCGLADSLSDARRKVQQGGVRINGRKVGAGDSTGLDQAEYVLQVGKHGVVKVVRG